MGDEIRLTVIATGFDSTSMHARSQRTRFTTALNSGSKEANQSENMENPVRRSLAEFGSQLYNTDEIEVPAFLRGLQNKN